MKAFNKMRIIIGAVITIGILAGMSPCVPAQSDEGLVAEWHFDEGSGNVLEDSSGNGNDGVIRGASWVDGKFGKALSFDGKDDYVEIVHPFSLLNTGKITIGAWTNPISSAYMNVKTLISIGECTASGAGLYVPSTQGYIQFSSASNYGLHSVYTAFPGDDQWLHVVCTYDGNYSKIYVNGRLKSKVNHTGSMITPTSGTNIGAIKCNNKYRNGAYFFNGLIDEIRIYNRALSAEEIKAHYEGGQTALFITKSASPHSIKQGQATTVTLTVKNTGATEIKNVEVSDSVPTDFTLISGEPYKKYDFLNPKDSRNFQYAIQSSESGTFNLDPATATYADEKGNYYTTKSNTAIIEVVPSLETPIPIKTPAPTTASAKLHGEKTDVVLGEDILLRLSAVNLITKPPMTVQVIIIPPSGMSVTSAEFTKTIAGQYATTYKLEPGDGKDIEVQIKSNQVGDFVVEGRIVYYFGDDITTGEDHTLTLPIKVKPEREITSKPTATGQTEETPGFSALMVLLALMLLTAFLGKRR